MSTKNKFLGKRFIAGFFVSVLMFSLVQSAGWGYDERGHSKDWNRVFGINDSESAKNIQPLWDVMQKLIDSTKYLNEEKGSDYRRVKDEFKWFTWGSYKAGGHGHRLFFHWGFNADLRQYPPLEAQVKRCLKKYAETQLEAGKTPEQVKAECEQQREAFFKLLFKIQGERNRALINKVIEVTGIPTSRGYANAVATILYNTHLLGDYTTTWTSALPGIRALEHDLLERGFTRLLRGGESEKLKKISQELKQATNAGRGRTDKVRAELLLKVVGKFLPEILEARFGTHLVGRGIKITLISE